VGLGAGILVYLLVVWKRGGGLAFGRNFVKITGVAGAALLVVWLVLILPPQRDEKAFLSALEGRFGLEAAASSRLAQIEPIKQAILKSPLVGYGFGKTITYYSADPRLMPQTAGGSGEITTYAFEWGYLDLILKFGIIGTVVYLFFIFVILRKLLIFNFQFLISKQIKNSNDQSSNLRVTDYELRITSYGLRTGFALALVTLLVVNIFSPYLNHPLGIGFIIISMVMSFRTPIIIGGGIS
jgi:O-antigen ligase